MVLRARPRIPRGRAQRGQTHAQAVGEPANPFNFSPIIFDDGGARSRQADKDTKKKNYSNWLRSRLVVASRLSDLLTA